MRPSNSFQPDEVAVLEALCRAETTRPKSTIARSKAFAGLYRKARQMKVKVLAHEIESEIAEMKERS